ncbi:hypothetical protein RJ639_011993 [Escallonia herrerae]|uniref:DUF4283 domain-containing protein n=1 Tax=Escallonia herrerae TaxID=1293975 RepID=A0AA88VNC4_9ASTE|nr:hypothetical protein RJ639_011993 [Escallonia herrerae]
MESRTPTLAALFDQWPRIRISPEEIKRLWSPWQRGLIVKLLGRTVGFRLLYQRMKSLWKLQGDFEAVDLGNDFYVVRFQTREDYAHVLLDGPWVWLNGHLQNVEYEGLYAVCFHCGKYGHKLESFPSLRKTPPDSEHAPIEEQDDGSSGMNLDTGSGLNPTHDPGTTIQEQAYGPWMIVQPRSRRNSWASRSSPFKYAQFGNSNPSSTGQNAKILQRNSGSRFNVLTTEELTEEVQINKEGTQYANSLSAQLRTSQIQEPHTNRGNQHFKGDRIKQIKNHQASKAKESNRLGVPNPFEPKLNSINLSTPHTLTPEPVNPSTGPLPEVASLPRPPDGNSEHIVSSSKENTLPFTHANGNLDNDGMDKSDANLEVAQGNATFLRNLVELVKTHNAEIFVLMEVRVQGHRSEDILRRTGYNKVLNAVVKGNDIEDWLFSAVYATPNRTAKSDLWNYLEEMTNNMQLPWLVAGDFNDIANSTEKWGGIPTSRNRCSTFVNRINSCQLLDLGFQGPLFTWFRNRNGHCYLKERLDRGLCNRQWRLNFPEAFIKHLPRTHSDHCPILIDTKGETPPAHSLRPFRFKAAWLTHPDFNRLVKDNWIYEQQDVQGTICRFVESVKSWNFHVFGNIFRNKKVLLARIVGIQRYLCTKRSVFLKNLKKRLVWAYNHTLLQEEIFWFQKSRSSWLNFGDRNTAYFHMSTVIRRRKNRITCLKDSEGGWCSDPIRLKELAVQHFRALYSDTHDTNNGFDIRPLFPCISQQEMNSLVTPVTLIEVKEATFSMKPYKSPGPDGLQPIFFQRYWDIVGHSLLDTHARGADGSRVMGFYKPMLEMAALEQLRITDNYIKTSVSGAPSG